MKVLVIGSGGREHALAWKIRQSPRVTQVYCAPGNPGTAALGTNVEIRADDIEGLAEFAKREGIDLTVVGPDDTLAAGVSDRFQAEGLRIFGPGKEAAQLESSKIFAKEFMRRHGIPTAKSGEFNDAEAALEFLRNTNHPVVVKADGLALGKGVVIAPDLAASEQAIREMMVEAKFGSAGSRVLIEEFLTGQEASIHAVIDGASALIFPPAQDHKQAFDGDTGPNTGGMGTYSPPPVMTPGLLEQVRTQVIERFLAGLKADGLRFQGMLFPGLMLTPDGIRVLEFNCRFGDPETQSLLRRLESDLVDILDATVDGRLAEVQPKWDVRPAVCVVMASGGYPNSYPKGLPITGISDAETDPAVTVFHAGTSTKDGQLVTAGGRVLGVTAVGESIQDARDHAYAAVEKIRFDKAHYRRDIAAKGLLRT